jgi:phosphoglycerol transferase MdoB-like AlkP superfamily enzyme
MLKRLSFLFKYWIFWIVSFQLFRILFLAYHHKKASEIGHALIAQSIWHGVRMDISFASYILVIPSLLMAFTGKKWLWYNRTMHVYSTVVSLVIVTMVVFDLELFRAWGFRIDSTSLHYLKTPTEAFASMAAAPVIPLLILLIIMSVVMVKSFIRLDDRNIPFFDRTPLVYNFLVFLFLTSTLIIPIRGGLQQIPMNESNAYFSDKSFANYAAINVPWNYASSVINSSYSKSNPYVTFDEIKADQIVANLYSPEDEHEQLIRNNTKPNVVIIIWESFTAKIVKSLGGVSGVTPQFAKLTDEGILFSNIYASGNRSDKGMVAILSGYPSQPIPSIIKIPTKTASLPSLPKTFKNNGYFTSFYYGGETEFANMKSYFLQQGFDHITDKHSFQKEDMNSKWGAHDHVVFNRLLADLDNQKQPFFSTIFTLSSHEPFEVPVKTLIAGNDTEHLFMNAHHYTDSALGDFIKKAMTKSWWSNTLVVIIADHGHPLPEQPVGKLNEFHIPMLWLGGALEKKSLIIDTLASQTDLASTLLHQLNLNAAAFTWSNDIMKKNRTPFAYFAFNNGMAWIKPKGFIVQENVGRNIIEQQGNLPRNEMEKGRAYLQASFADYLKR